MTIEDVETFCKSLRIPLDVNIELDEQEVRISIRDGVHDEPPQSVYEVARDTMKSIRDKFGDAVKVGSEVVDEFIDVTVHIKANK